MTPSNIHTVLANGAEPPENCTDPIILDYRPNICCTRRIKLNLPQFVVNLFHLPDRTLDLLELAAYIFGADRCISRGRIDAVEYHSWSRKINIIIKVRDFEFWSDANVSEKLTDLLEFMMGDNGLKITFQPNHSTPPTGLFDDIKYKPWVSEKGLKVVLFSGGVDSLAGALNFLESGPETIVLACHQSNNTIKKTQRGLYKALENRYPNRIQPYSFQCSLQGQRAIDETQRSRSFLFTAIAFALVLWGINSMTYFYAAKFCFSSSLASNFFRSSRVNFHSKGFDTFSYSV